MNWTHVWDTALHWVTLHPVVAYLGIFGVALSESLALVGLLIPGTVIMIGIGALAGSGALSIKVTLVAAMLGAVVGDGISYWLGRYYQLGLKARWPFRNYPQLLVRGEEFFHKHGGKSVLLGRFVGPVRPIIPVIAGMLDMPVERFLAVNILSAVGWAFAYLIPGVLLGGSLTLVGAVSTRLSLLLLLLVLLLWLTFSLGHQVFNWLGRLGPKGERLLPLLGLALFLAGWVFLGVLEDLVNLDPLVQADQAIYRFLQSLRTPWGDWLLVAVTELGDSLVNLPIAVTVFVLLILLRKFRAAAYWLLALGGGAALVQLFKWTMHRPRPIDIYQGISSWGFPSGHTTMSVVLYGFLAILLVRSCNPRWRWLPFSAAIGISLCIAFSRLYLGAHWLSDVLGGLSLGWAWVTLLGIVYLRGSDDTLPKKLLLGGVLLAILLAGAWHIHGRHAQDLARYQVQKPAQELPAASWQDLGWQELPGRRIDLAGEDEGPLNLQWAGDPGQLSALLIAQGWRPSPGLNLKHYLNILTPQAALQQLPVLPLLEDGRQERLLLSLTLKNERVVLRLWPTDFQLSESNQPLWVGSVDREVANSMADLFTIPRGTREYSAALQQLRQFLPPEVIVGSVRRPVKVKLPAQRWDGQTLLLTESLILGSEH
jgi:membrane protein DedA with SNARE-associated domain/membrane-associated phospholipid phosphatase